MNSAIISPGWRTNTTPRTWPTKRSTERPEPWEPNVTADPHAAKWSALIAPGTPLPTPWPKEAV